MERRVLVAIFLAFLVLYVWQALFVKPVPKSASGTAVATDVTAATSPINAAQPPAAAARSTEPPKPSASSATALVATTSERDVRIETRDVIAVFTNRGARLKSWRLKHYPNQQRQPQELVEEQIGTQSLPFSLQTPDDAMTTTLNEALYDVTGAPPSSEAVTSPIDLKFEYRDSSGLRAAKEFHFEPSSYVVVVRATVHQGDRAISAAVSWGPAIGDIGEVSRNMTKAEGLLFQNGKVQRLAPKDFAKQAVYDGDFRYAGVDDNYFMTAALTPGPAKVSFQPVSIPPPPGSKEPARDLVAYAIEPNVGGTPIKFFAGPKDFDVLSTIDPDVPLAINFGMFKVIVVPLLQSLKWVNGFVGNYGWSIIILTVIINGIMFPLRHKSVVSMRKMQEIQPDVKAIQDRYAKLKATDPAKQKMNQELMALYKEKGVNPASGCVPMLLTMPFIFAFYSLLSTAIELRGAPFVWWIHDLSSHDPYFVTPILMGISQVWQQRLAPATGMDPAQQKMMLVMPVFFTFLFLWYPAGVALYWLVNNVFAIGQQYATNYLIGPPNIRTIRPAAERRMKRAGGGKTDAAARESSEAL
jgi:YidC/Oxa1 family membrane protein insertase